MYFLINFGISEKFFQKQDIHVHVPEGAVPKDGPSAGIAMTAAIISAFTGIPTKKEVAMTGEVTLRGRVLEIGGLKEKVIAAHRAGVKTVIVPEDNRKDLEDTGLTETMSLQGSCWMLTRDKYRELNVCDENFGSWGSQGIEVAVKTWLSGGQVLVNHNTWYAHMFRTQGGDFGFPYPISSKDQDKAKQFAKDLFFNNNWDKQIQPLSWLVEKFWPVKGWSEEDLIMLKANNFEFKEVAAAINTTEIEPRPEDDQPLTGTEEPTNTESKSKTRDNNKPVLGSIYYFGKRFDLDN